MEESTVKLIKYVAEDSSGSEDEKFQKIYDNHIENKKIKYRKVKPLTILVSKDIAACERLTDKLVNFISKKEKITKEEAAQKVLIVTSSNKHKDNVSKLKNVDDKKESVEWITSVSMLSEGWDVKNVFQIVPHEERAFNSKLLIAQVLGRGLRIPEAYKGERPLVTVFNHDKWSSSIKHLVDEVLEIEKRIHSYAIEKKEDYNFNLYNMEYKKVEKTEETPQEKEYEFKKGYITFSSQAPKVEKATTYVRALGGEQEVKKTTIEFKMYSVAEAVQEVFNKLRVIDMDLNTTYSKKFSKEKIAQIIRNSLRRIGEKKDRISQDNLQKTLQAFGVVYRKKTKSLRFRIQEERLRKVTTKQIDKNSLGIGNLRRDSSIFYDEYSLNKGEAEDKKLLKDLQNDETLPRSALIYVQNEYNFKTPVNISLGAYKPEREFIRCLVEEENAKVIDAWIKSLDIGFYSIEYSWRKGEHPKQGSFNPDFFIKVGNDILVIEIKMDKDVSDENRAKLKYARAHFNRVNKFQHSQKYYFKFLSPESYDLFFQELRKRNHVKFKSKLEASLE
jgi:type III restriction enzyme